MDVAEIVGSIHAKSAVVGVIGLGYVGLPLALTFVSKGFRIIGFDVDPEKVTLLSQGRSYLGHMEDRTIATAVATGRLEATVDFTRLAEADAIIVCVPTPLAHGTYDPDMSYVEKTSETIARYLRPGQMVVLESTTYPGTTREVVKPILERKGFKSGRDFLLAYSPEREDPGNAEFSTAKIPKVVGGDDAGALQAAVALYSAVVVRVVPVTSLDTAEAVKITENMFRAVNIALVNELKLIYGAMGIDVWEVIEAAKTKPFGFMPFYPGPGWGGHCIPIDPFYLSWRARQFGHESRFVELAGELNAEMPRHVVATLDAELKKRFAKNVTGARILLLGLAYKKNVDDTRESPAYALFEMLEDAGAQVDYYDPHVPVVPQTREHARFAGRKSVAWDERMLASYDVALVCTDHDGVDYAALARICPLVVDTRNALAGVSDGREKVVKA